MKKIQFLLFLLLSVLISSCYTSKFTYDYLSGIHPGMVPDEVMAVLGKPTYRSFDDNVETWEYRDTYSRFDKVIKILFVDNKVSKMDNYADKYMVYPFGDTSTEDKKKEEKEKKKSSDKASSSTKVRVTSDGKHVIQSGSIIVTPEGKHEVVVSDHGGLIITASGEHIIAH